MNTMYILFAFRLKNGSKSQYHVLLKQMTGLRHPVKVCLYTQYAERIISVK